MADDSQINLEAIKANLLDIGYDKNVNYYYNGQEVFDAVKENLRKFVSAETATFKPIKALLLDFQMPTMNGLQTVSAVKKLYQNVRNELAV